MKQAILLFSHERDSALLDLYRCSECSRRFDMQQTGVAPRACPACGVIYDLTREQLIEQLARCALAFNMSPTTLLWILRIVSGAFSGIPR